MGLGIGRKFKKAVKKLDRVAKKVTKNVLKVGTGGLVKDKYLNKISSPEDILRTVGNAVSGGAFRKAKHAKQEAKRNQAEAAAKAAQMAENDAQAQRAEHQVQADSSSTFREDRDRGTSLTGKDGDGAPAEIRKKRLLGS